jgi:hypothetical protein
MGSQDITHNPSFYFSIGAQVLVTLVLLGLVIVGIVVQSERRPGGVRAAALSWQLPLPCKLAWPHSSF